MSVTASVATAPLFNTTPMIPVNHPPAEAQCRDRGGYVDLPVYTLLTCAMCFKYVIRDIPTVKEDISYTQLFGLRIAINIATGENETLSVTPDISNSTSVGLVCDAVGHSLQCKRWTDCCQNALHCCEEQLQLGKGEKESTCPHTWDGFSCIPETPAGQTVTLDCPHYSGPLGTEAYSYHNAYKTCLSNGTWLMRADREWTDYTKCSNKQHYQRLHIAIVACNAITITLVLPACFIFLFFRPLRQQQRIRLHVCLLGSSLLLALTKLLWESTIHGTRDGSSALEDNSGGCRLLSILTRYAFTSTYCWMLVEGFHLHRLLVQAFSVPKSHLPYYVFGFGFPVLPSLCYAIARGVQDELNVKCWSKQAGSLEFVFHVPVLLALLLNTAFLLRIVYIMVKQLEPHPNEPNNFRRAIKAVAVLVPLFGIQILVFIYRPPSTNRFVDVYEIISQVFIGLQGAFIAMVFCYFNREVQGHLKAYFLRLVRGDRGGYGGDFTRASLSMTTQYTVDTSRSRMADGNSTIPLRPIYIAQHTNGSGDGTKERGNNNEITSNGGPLHSTLAKTEEEVPLNPPANGDSEL